jgi:hypothetical protein
MISFTSDASSLKKRENQAFMLRVMEQQLERMNINLMSILNKQIKKMLNCKRDNHKGFLMLRGKINKGSKFQRLMMKDIL